MESVVALDKVFFTESMYSATTTPLSLIDLYVKGDEVRQPIEKHYIVQLRFGSASHNEYLQGCWEGSIFGELSFPRHEMELTKVSMQWSSESFAEMWDKEDDQYWNSY